MLKSNLEIPDYDFDPLRGCSKVPDSKRQNPKFALLMFTLFLSGVAGLINQVVWQRALKVFLGGSETLSSMTVVLVFLAGLGSGSFWMGGKSGRLRLPSLTLGTIELCLAIANGLICFALSRDFSETIYFFQRTAAGIGIPLRVVYVLGACALLAAPCFLMGATMPLASAICQNEFVLKENRLVNRLYGINTFGAFLGSIIGVGILVPHYGQRFTLLTAASLNLAAAVFLFFWVSQAKSSASLRQNKRSVLRPDCSLGSSEEAQRNSGFAILAFGFGFCALWYEMFLYRAVALRHEPLALVFSAVLTGFLVFWSLGSYASSLRGFSCRLSLVGFLSTIAGAIALYFYAFYDAPFPLYTASGVFRFLLLKLPYFIPCFFFGLLFGLVIAKGIRIWGRDVGWLNGWNTFGCCCGVLSATLIGYELNLTAMIFLQWLVLLALCGVADKIEINALRKGQSPPASSTFRLWFCNPPTLAFGLLALITVIGCLASGPLVAKDGSLSLYGRDGVIMIDSDGNLAWDGLWHSRLSKGNDHVGSYNWALAIDPILAHSTGDVRDALVIGVGSGITLGTLAKHHSISMVDAYDISQTLKQVLQYYPDGTLRVASNPKIRIIWQDGRSGLATNPKKYDLITQQPLYLKQAGSSILLSKEYFQLVASRLREGGVFCVYANGTPEQALAVRQTASEVFPHRLVLHNGYQLILSGVPIEFSPERLNRLTQREGPLWEEIRHFRRTVGEMRWLDHIRSYNLPMADSRITIRDDFPIVEYPLRIRARLRDLNFTSTLPQPRYEWKSQ